MFIKPQQLRWIGILGLIWFAGVGVDRLWLAIDQAVPSWDPADNLTNSLNFWWTLQHPQWFSGAWWAELWALSSKYPPLLFVATVPFLNLLGTGADRAVTVNLLFSAILLASVYGIGKHLFNPQVGLWAAGLCLLFPRLYTNRLEYFMDYSQTALVAASFYGLTLWRDEKARSRQWFWALEFGCCFGLAILTKQSALFFLVVPLLWVGITALRQRDGQRFLQLMSGSLLTLAIVLPWVSTNWIFQISAGFNSNIKSAIDEGDPPLNTLAAWTYYWHDLPRAVSLPLLVVPLAGVLLYALRQKDKAAIRQERTALGWLAVFWLGSYLLWSAIFNKDLRYIMPYLPIVAVALAYGLTRWSWRWRAVPIATVGLAAALMLVNLFPIGGATGAALAQALSPQARFQPYTGAAFPHTAIVDAIIRTQPYQLANIGMLASTPAVNQHTFNYYGNLRNFQVYSRQMGRGSEDIADDLRAVSWFLMQDQPNSHRDDDDPRSKTIRAIEQSPEFRRFDTWTLPDQSRVRLYHRPVLPVEVQPSATEENTSAPLRLDRVTLPDRAPPAEPLPVTYEWSGTWEQLHSGLVLLTWRHQSDRANSWIHDHGLGLGTLHPAPIQANQSTVGRSTVEATQRFKIIERIAMLPPDDAAPGVYRLEATYLNAHTGETAAIAVPPVSVTIDPAAPVLTTIAELDAVTRLRLLARHLPKGAARLERIAHKIGQFNMYDPIQSYVVQAEKTLAYRLQQDPANRNYAYGLALAHALQQQTEAAIDALQHAIQFDDQNPNAYAYLAALNLYAFRPQAAEVALQSALAIDPDAPELQALSSVTALMRGNLWQAWQTGRIALRTWDTIDGE